MVNPVDLYSVIYLNKCTCVENEKKCDQPAVALAFFNPKIAGHDMEKVWLCQCHLEEVEAKHSLLTKESK